MPFLLAVRNEVYNRIPTHLATTASFAAGIVRLGIYPYAAAGASPPMPVGIVPPIFAEIVRWFVCTRLSASPTQSGCAVYAMPVKITGIPSAYAAYRPVSFLSIVPYVCMRAAFSGLLTAFTALHPVAILIPCQTILAGMRRYLSRLSANRTQPGCAIYDMIFKITEYPFAYAVYAYPPVH